VPVEAQCPACRSLPVEAQFPPRRPHQVLLSALEQELGLVVVDEEPQFLFQ
jgi:hypothetical protein